MTDQALLPPANPPPPVQDALVDKLATPQDAAAQAQLKMPNERDESINMTADQPDPVVKQAAKDVARGLVDTSNGAELDRTYRKLK